MVSKRILNLTPSATSSLVGTIAELRAKGESIIGFNIGEPDFPTPEKVVAACKEALDQGYTKYCPVAGIIPLRQAIAEKLKKDNDLDYTIDQIIVSTGAKQSLYNACMAMLNPGDEVILLAPCWVSYMEMIKMAEATPVIVETKADFTPDLDKIKAAVTPRTKAILINSPNNPTGVVYCREDLEAIANIAIEHDFYIISDEVYEKLIFGDSKHISIASLSKEAYDRTITINGVSKAYSMTGWRVGYAAGPKDLIKGMVSLQGHLTSNSTTFVQYACVTALKECDQETEEMRKEFEKRRDFTYEKINSIPGLKTPKPEGAFYMMADVTAYFNKRYGDYQITNAIELCDYLLKEGKVAVVPGDAFCMPGTIRIAYPLSIETVEEGLNRVAAALAKLQ